MFDIWAYHIAIGHEPGLFGSAPGNSNACQPCFHETAHAWKQQPLTLLRTTYTNAGLQEFLQTQRLFMTDMICDWLNCSLKLQPAESSSKDERKLNAIRLCENEHAQKATVRRNSWTNTPKSHEGVDEPTIQLVENSPAWLQLENRSKAKLTSIQLSQDVILFLPWCTQIWVSNLVLRAEKEKNSVSVMMQKWGLILKTNL